jgi:hypothetical protein
VYSYIRRETGPYIRLSELTFCLCSTEYIFATDGNFVGNRNPNGTWTGVFGMFQSGEVEITNIVLSMVSMRMEIVDYSFATREIR